MHEEVERYLRHIRTQVSTATHLQARKCLDLFNRYCEKNRIELLICKQSEIEAFLLSRKCSQETKKSYCRTIARFFAFLQCSDNPAAAVRLSKKVRRRLPAVPGEDKLRQAMERITGCNHQIELRNRAMAELAYGSGLRIGELERLNIEDIDLSECTAFIRGKGDRERIVPLTLASVAAIREYLSSRPERRGPFLAAYLTGRRIKTAQIGAIFREQTGIRAHLFRHACATHMHQRGCGIRFIQDLLGHADLSTTQVYTQINVEDLRQIINYFHPRGQKDEKTYPNPKIALCSR